MKKKYKIIILVIVGLLVIHSLFMFINFHCSTIGYIDLNSGIVRYEYILFDLCLYEETVQSKFYLKFNNMLPQKDPDWMFGYGRLGIVTCGWMYARGYMSEFESFAHCHDDSIGPERTRYYLNQFMQYMSKGKDYDEGEVQQLVSDMLDEWAQVKRAHSVVDKN